MNKWNWRFAFALLALIPGCAPLGDSWTLWVDPAFSAQDQAALTAAAARWEAAVPAHFVVRYGTCLGDHDGWICTHAANAATVHQISDDPNSQAVTIRSAWINGSDTYVDVAGLAAHAAEAPWNRDYVFAHELGHAMGGDHGDPDNRGTPGTVMFWTENGASDGTVTCLDALRWQMLRGKKIRPCLGGLTAPAGDQIPPAGENNGS